MAILYLPRENRKLRNILKLRITHFNAEGKVWGGGVLPITILSGGKIHFRADTVAVEKIDEGAVVSSPSNKVTVELPKRKLTRKGLLLKKRLQDYIRKINKRIRARKIKDGSYEDYLEEHRKYRLKHYWKNREKISAYQKIYRQKNLKRIRAYERRKYRKLKKSIGKIRGKNEK